MLLLWRTLLWTRRLLDVDSEFLFRLVFIHRSGGIMHFLIQTSSLAEPADRRSAHCEIKHQENGANMVVGCESMRWTRTVMLRRGSICHVRALSATLAYVPLQVVTLHHFSCSLCFVRHSGDSPSLSAWARKHIWGGDALALKPRILQSPVTKRDGTPGSTRPYCLWALCPSLPLLSVHGS